MSGKLYVIGTGPGKPEGATLQAREALAQCQVVLGYKTYIEQIRPMLRADQEVAASGMTKELDRAAKAIELALEGKVVGMISGGDAGIYAMAGVVFEAAKAKGVALDAAAGGLEIEVIAGVPALAAAAAVLGAPLTHDFACISLSDRLTQWEVITKRLDAAAAADFVMVIYNPKSKGRDWQLGEALQIVQKHRSGQTPVGIVQKASRQGQKMILSSLAEVPLEQVDMQTLLIIGNTNSFVYQGRMVTPRGYINKYGEDF